jgi:nicotinamide-nucleotide amidase
VAHTAPTALLLSIGSELLLGETVDTNAAWLSRELALLGLDLRGVHQLADDREVIAHAFSSGMAGHDLVLATGGLGPTHDDLTREGLADALGEELIEDGGLAEALRDRFGGAGRMPVSNLRQAQLIASAKPLDNPIGSAPGWWVEREGRSVALMPGVPAEMQLMWREQVAPRLERKLGLRPLAVRAVKTFGVGESAVAERLGDLLVAPGHGIDAGIYARDDGVHLRFSTRLDAFRLEDPVQRAISVLGDDVYGTDAETLPRLALAALQRAGLATLASVESGTDGALLAILAAHQAADGEARYLGGALFVDGEPQQAPATADAVLTVRLAPQGALGRSRVAVDLAAPRIGFDERVVRIHGSGQQRLRRAAFAALDQVRRGAVTPQRIGGRA